MSTCPDKKLYSAYADNELPDKWKKKLEAHTLDCSPCRSVLEEYLNLKHSLSKESCPEIDFEQSYKKLCYKKKAVKEFFEEDSDLEQTAWFKKSIKEPLPVFAAAASFFIIFLIAVVLKLQTTVPTPSGGAFEAEHFHPIVPVVHVNRSFPLCKKNKLNLKTQAFSKFIPEKTLNKKAPPAVCSRDLSAAFSGFVKLYVPPKNGFQKNEVLLIHIPDTYVNRGVYGFSSFKARKSLNNDK